MTTKPEPASHFVSEPITPKPGSFDTRGLTANLTALPSAFTWRGQTLRIKAVLHRGKKDTADVGEMYLRRETFQVELEDSRTADLYFERSAPAGASRKRAKQRWYLFTISAPKPPTLTSE